MSIDTIPTRANLQTIDQTWFNIIQAVLGLDLVPRNSSGVVTDIGGNMGNATYAWAAAYAQSLLLRNSGKFVTINPPSGLAASYTLTLPAALPSALSKLQVDTSGNIGYGVSAPLTTGNSGNFGTAATSGSFTAVTNLNKTFTATGRPVLITFNPVNATASCFISNGATSGALKIQKNGTDLASVDVPQTFSASMMNFLDPTPSAGSTKYELFACVLGGNGTTQLIQVEFISMTVIEL